MYQQKENYFYEKNKYYNVNFDNIHRRPEQLRYCTVRFKLFALHTLSYGNRQYLVNHTDFWFLLICDLITFNIFILMVWIWSMLYEANFHLERKIIGACPSKIEHLDLRPTIPMPTSSSIFESQYHMWTFGSKELPFLKQRARKSGFLFQ